MKTQGNERMTLTHNVVGESEKPITNAIRPYGPVVDQVEGQMVDVSYAAGRTISLGNFEFVRILIGARVRIADLAAVDAAITGVQQFVGEVLGREEALVRKQPVGSGSLPPLDGVRREIWVEYGMTLNAGVKYESHKVDLGLSRPLGDEEEAEGAMAELEAYLSQRVGAERDRLQGKNA